MESIKWCGVVMVDEPKWGVVKVDVYETTRFRILPKILQPIGRRAKVNTLHGFGLRMIIASKLEDFLR